MKTKIINVELMKKEGNYYDLFFSLLERDNGRLSRSEREDNFDLIIVCHTT